MDISSLRDREIIAPFSVSQLNGYIKQLFENNRTLAAVTVKGEISNFTNHRSGHMYFSLKDEDGQIRAVMFRSHVASLRFMPESGMRVIVTGSVNVYARDGSYQIYVTSMQPDGIGDLYVAYEQLKEKLSKEGLFSPEHKLSLPKIPMRIGVITSPTGAAVRDIINVLGRRFPMASIYLYPSLVQGDGASENLIEAVDYFDKSRLCDVVIIGRGGGSIEDLWAFNSEKLARRIYEAEVPIISAVGHETDFTICDFVSDMRAPTPSAAAEIAVPDSRELMLRIDSYEERLALSLKLKVANLRDKLSSMERFAKGTVPLGYLERRRNAIALYNEKTVNAILCKLSELKGSLAINAKKLDAMSPLSVISRGYSLAEKDGAVIHSVSQIDVGDELCIRISDGVFGAVVTNINDEEYKNGEN